MVQGRRLREQERESVAAAERGEGYKEMYRSPVMGGQASP